LHIKIVTQYEELDEQMNKRTAFIRRLMVAQNSETYKGKTKKKCERGRRAVGLTYRPIYTAEKENEHLLCTVDELPQQTE